MNILTKIINFFFPKPEFNIRTEEDLAREWIKLLEDNHALMCNPDKPFIVNLTIKPEEFISPVYNAGFIKKEEPKYITFNKK